MSIWFDNKVVIIAKPGSKELCKLFPWLAEWADRITIQSSMQNMSPIAVSSESRIYPDLMFVENINCDVNPNYQIFLRKGKKQIKIVDESKRELDPRFGLDSYDEPRYRNRQRQDFSIRGYDELGKLIDEYDCHHDWITMREGMPDEYKFCRICMEKISPSCPDCGSTEIDDSIVGTSIYLVHKPSCVQLLPATAP